MQASKGTRVHHSVFTEKLSSVKRKAQNIDNESNKRKVVALFEDSGSEEDREKEIKTTWTESFKKAIERLVMKQTVKARWLRFQIITL